MTTPGSRPRKGWLSNLQAAMAPVAPEDDGSPIVRPKSVTIAAVLGFLAGLVFLFVGGLSLLTAGTQVDQVRTSYSDLVKRCTNEVGGIGSAVPGAAATTPVTPAPAAATTTGGTTTAASPSLTGLASTCVQVTSPTLTEGQLTSYRSQIRIYSLIIAAIGLAAAVGAFFLLNGAKWSRRLLIAAAAVSLLLALLLQVSTPLTLLATLLLVAGILLTYIGKGGMYFLRLAGRRARH